jgi:hypothetical protein
VDRLTFVSELVKSLAWPIAVIACAVLARRPLAALVPFLRTIKYSDVEVSFGKEVARSESVGERLPAPAETKTLQQTRDSLIQLASVRPRTAIRETWRAVENAVLEAAKRERLELAPTARSMPMVVGSLMFNSGVISETQYQVLSQLRQITDEAERAPVDSLKVDDARRVIDLSLKLIASLDVGDDAHRAASAASA